MAQSTIDSETATAHQIMAAAGKKILRPGGKAATEQLFQWAGFKPGELEKQVQLIEGNVFHLEQVSGQFDYVLAEAILTMQSLPPKILILNGIHDRLKLGGKFLSHELMANEQEEEIHHALVATLRANSTPLSEINWIATCTEK